ncbi:MAG: hypothetical protein HC901_01975, partial [Bdellovibrionaceae bacterium]|nr:hypothetical protein [Pseudobdellovibrionaceae bacterium]
MTFGVSLSPVLVHLMDVVLCTVVLRVVLGWMVAYPRLLQLLGILVLLTRLGFFG